MFGAELNPGLVHSSLCFEFVLIHLQRSQTLQVQYRKCLLLNYLCKGRILFFFLCPPWQLQDHRRRRRGRRAVSWQRRCRGEGTERVWKQALFLWRTQTHLAGLMTASPTGWRNKWTDEPFKPQSDSKHNIYCPVCLPRQQVDELQSSASCNMWEMMKRLTKVFTKFLLFTSNSCCFIWSIYRERHTL